MSTTTLRGVALAATLTAALACSTNRTADSPRAQTPAAEVESSADPGGSGAALARVDGAAAGWASSGFAASSHWDDGKAEVVRYAGTRSRYGQRRDFEMTVIHVKEEFDAAKLVKSDWPERAETLQVIKSNVVFSMPTENYPYNLSSGTFMRRDNPSSLVKLTTTSHEWCGITTKNLDLRGDTPALKYRSYFESEGEGEFDLSEWPEGGVAEEQLVFAVRDLKFEEGLKVPVTVLSRQLESHARTPTWRPGELVVVDTRTVKDAGGKDHEVWHVEARLGGDTLSYDVGVAAPHLLVRFDGTEGASMVLEEATRWAYWDFSKPSPF